MGGTPGSLRYGFGTPRHHASELSPGDSGARGPGAEAGPSVRRGGGRGGIRRSDRWASAEDVGASVNLCEPVGRTV